MTSSTVDLFKGFGKRNTGISKLMILSNEGLYEMISGQILFELKYKPSRANCSI